MPVDRQRMRPWLEEQINSGLIQGLHWVNKERKIFQIPWMHAARHGWNLDKDAPLFMNWAIHTEKYRHGIDKPDPKTWKANFRCALNSLHDIEEVKDLSMKKGNNAFRMYRMLSASESALRKGKKKLEGEPKIRKRRSKEQREQMPIKEETLPDSTVFWTAEPDQPCCPGTGKKMTASNPPDVCANVEISTENKESTVSSTQIPYPLQVSPVSFCSDSDADNTGSDSDSNEVHHPQDLSVNSSRKSQFTALRIPPSATHRTHSFTISGKEKFFVTACQEESPIFPYNEPAWRPFFSSFPFDTVLDLSMNSTPHTPEVIKAMDLSSSSCSPSSSADRGQQETRTSAAK